MSKHGFFERYQSYKEWWFEYEGPARMYEECGTEDNLPLLKELFEIHINEMSLYELVTTLENWDE